MQKSFFCMIEVQSSFIRRYEKDNSLEIYGLDFSPEYKTKENVTKLIILRIIFVDFFTIFV